MFFIIPWKFIMNDRFPTIKFFYYLAVLIFTLIDG